MIDTGLTRADSPRAERDLPRIWRAGPAGGPPGGPGVTQIDYVVSGLNERPWSPAHLRATARADGGIDLGWIGRSRIDGDRWDGATAEAGPARYRIRVLDGPVERRLFEVEASGAVYPAGDLAADFPDGPGAAATFAVSQWGAGYGWGVEAKAALIA